jgi:hypothetical protein
MKNGKCIFEDGREEWYKNNLLHRDDGPSITWANGVMEWCLNGIYMRIDGPSGIYPTGHLEWTIHTTHPKSKYDLDHTTKIIKLNNLIIIRFLFSNTQLI